MVLNGEVNMRTGYKSHFIFTEYLNPIIGNLTFQSTIPKTQIHNIKQFQLIFILHKVSNIYFNKFKTQAIPSN